MEDLDKRYQTIVVLWAAFLMNVGVFFVVSLFVVRQDVAPPPFNSLISFVFAAVGTFSVVLSFVVKSKMLQRSVDQQNPALVQPALVIACAMCEVCALLGLVEAMAIGGRDHYVLFFIAIVGIVFHFPRRSQLQAASYKTGGTQTF